MPRRQLARRLQLLREEARLTLEEAAPALDWSTSKLSRIENAQQRVDTHGVRGMLDLYGVGGDQWGELIELTRMAWQQGWWRAYTRDDNGYVPLESAASLIRDFTVCYVPGLLQTADYARAIFEASLIRRTAEKLENAIAIRMIRQQRLTSLNDPLQLVAIIDESVLLRPVGGRSVMAAQLDRLIEAAALDTVTLQILPMDVGAHPAMPGVFTLMSFGELNEPGMAYVEHPMGSVHLSKERDVARATLVFDRLRSDGLTPADSVGLIRRVREQQWT